MSTWYYYNESGEKIEVTGGQLKGLAKAGLITPETVVETEDGKTAPARKVKGLTFATTAPPIETESYGLAQPLKPPPEPSPFTASMPATAKPADSPFTVTMPKTSQAMPQSVSVPVAEDEEEESTNQPNPVAMFVVLGIGILILVMFVIGVSNSGGGGSSGGGSQNPSALVGEWAIESGSTYTILSVVSMDLLKDGTGVGEVPPAFGDRNRFTSSISFKWRVINGRLVLDFPDGSVKACDYKMSGKTFTVSLMEKNATYKRLK
jgi:hypothetical protein